MEQNGDNMHLDLRNRREEETLTENEDSLAFRLKNGDRQAAVELVDLYYQRIYLFMRRLGHGRQASEDLTQDCFLKAWSHIGQLRNYKALNSWLYQIASNTSRLYWRKQKSRIVEIPENDLFESGHAQSSHEKVAEIEEIKRIKKAVDCLPKKLKQAIILHYLQDLTIAQAAEAAGVRDGTLKSRLSRALKALRKKLN